MDELLEESVLEDALGFAAEEVLDVRRGVEVFLPMAPD